MRFWRLSARREVARWVGFDGAARTGAAGLRRLVSSPRPATAAARRARIVTQMAICCIENPRLTRRSFRMQTKDLARLVQYVDRPRPAGQGICVRGLIIPR